MFSFEPVSSEEVTWGLWEKVLWNCISKLTVYFFHSSEVIDFNSFCEMIKWARIRFLTYYCLQTRSVVMRSVVISYWSCQRLLHSSESLWKITSLFHQHLFLLHKIFPIDLEQCSRSSGGNCCSIPQCTDHPGWYHRRPIIIICRKILNRTLIANVVFGCNLSFYIRTAPNHVTYFTLWCIWKSADKDPKCASSRPTFKVQMSVCFWNYQEVLEYLLRLWKIMSMSRSVAILYYYFFLVLWEQRAKYCGQASSWHMQHIM